MQRVDIARNDRLDLVDDRCADQHRIDRDVRPARVRLALDLDREPVRRRHHWPRPDREFAERSPG